MDEFKIRIDPSNELQGELVVKVLINGFVVTDDDYCLDVDSFFKAAGLPKSIVRFVGSCGFPECCGTGYDTFSTQHNWQWDEFYLDWTDIYLAAIEIIDEIKRLSANDPCLPFYRQKLEALGNY